MLRGYAFGVASIIPGRRRPMAQASCRKRWKGGADTASLGWHERRGVLRQEGQRVSRHYYDLHCLLNSDVGRTALGDRDLGADCVRHARMFFDRPDYDLASAAAGGFAISPAGGMTEALGRASRQHNCHDLRDSSEL